MSYRILIAEDDRIILKGLMTTFPWASEGFEVPEGVSNGQQALASITSRHFDIVLTDINMPLVDGIELAQIVREKSSDTIVILFTGYESFSYAKKAVKLGVFDYLLKPVKPQVLKECLDRAKAKLQEIRQTEERLAHSLPLFRQKFLARLFTTSSQVASSEWEEAGIQRFTYPCIPFIGMISDWEQHDMDWDEILSFLEAELERISLGAIPLKENQIWALAHGTEEELGQKLSRVLTNFSAKWKVSLLFSVGQPVSEEREIADAFRETERLVDQYRFLIHDAVLHVSAKEEIRPAGKNVASLENDLWKVLEEGRENECEKILSALKDSFAPDEQDSYAMKLFFSIAFHVEQLVGQHILPPRIIDTNHTIELIIQAGSVDEQFTVLMDVVSLVCHVMEEKTASDPIGDQMLEFVDQHISDSQLSLTMLGEYLHKSVSYLSLLFKKKNGISFSDYVATHRMEKARILLCTTNEMVHTIARSVGIANPQYFGLRFKQMYGATPSEYREKLTEKS